MKRAVLYGAGGCALAAVIVAVVLYVKLGAIVKAAVETVGPKMTRTEVRVDSVSLSPFSGRGRIRGLFIGNPAGFKTPGAFQLSSVRVAVDLKSLRRDRVVIREILVERPEVTYEGSSSGSNLSRIQKNVESFALSARKGGEASKKRVEVGLFKAIHGKVNLSLTALGSKSMTVPLPDIELRDIGRKSGGATVEEAGKEILGAVISGALRSASGAGDVLKGGVEKVEGAGKSAAGKLKGLFRKKK